MKNHYVYRITNKVKNKHYYGVRSCKVIPKLDLGIKYLSSSVDKEFIRDQKENSKNYKYKIINIFNSRKEAMLFEIKLHDKFDVGINESFYNKAKQTSDKFSIYGMKHNNTSKEKMSNAKKGKPSPNKGKTFTKEHKEALSIAQKNRTDDRKISEETKKKISIANKGKKQSEEQKQNKSKSMLGRKLPESTKENMKKAHQNRSKDNEEKRCNKISEKMKGIKRSAETKEKMSSWQKGVEKPKIQCPHCLKIGGIGPMKQWHFDNCRNKNV